MFIYSVRASTIKFFSVIALTLLVLVGILVFGGSGDAVYASSGNIYFSGVKTDEQRVAFISQFGIKVKAGAVEEEEFRVPENFDRVISGYNEIQKRQGLDLSRYKNKKVTRYTYRVTNCNSTEREVYASLFVYRDRVIACDVSSGEPDGFVYPLIGIDRSLFVK